MPSAILSFWFEELMPADWWRADPLLDARIGARFGSVHEAAVAGELFEWRATPGGRLAEIIVLDQFSRNIHRGTPRAFAADPMALALAQEAVAAGIDASLPTPQVAFLYLPYMHSESRRIHRLAEQLFRREGLEKNHESELRHRAIIERFGRYPHRNAILGRTSTDEEQVFLAQPNSGF
jgi:uncharacterized protein (DUF924 family)